MKNGKTSYAVIVVQLDRFGHDTNGNAVARHVVLGYAQDKNSPVTTLYTTPRRLQIGYGPHRNCNAPAAMLKAGVVVHEYDFDKREGDRTDGTIYLTYNKNN